MTERDHLSSRRTFLGRGALATAGLVAAGTLALPSLPAHALTLGGGDEQTLDFLGRVQGLQEQFFARALSGLTADGLREGEGSLLNLIGEQDGEQKRWCQTALERFNAGGPSFPTTRPGGSKADRLSFPEFKTREGLLREALRLKSTAAGAWLDAVGRTGNGELSSAFASLAGVQNRHRALLAHLLGGDATFVPAPALSRGVASRRLERYGFTAEGYNA